MAIIFSDTLESYSIGQNPPSGFLDIGFFKGQIVANTFSRNDGSRVYQMGLNGEIFYQLSSNPTAASVYWLGVNTPDVGIANGSTGQLGQQLAYFHVESDLTVSLYVTSTTTGGLFGGAALIANSITPVVHNGVWQDYQAAFSLSTALFTSGTTTHTYVAVSGTAWVAGTAVCHGAGTTTLSATALPTGSLALDNIFFSGNGFVDDLWATDAALTTATFPFSNPTSARVTQAVIETVRRGVPSARVTQGVTEIIKRPIPSARVTQGVVEVIKRNTGVGWIVYEA